MGAAMQGLKVRVADRAMGRALSALCDAVRGVGGRALLVGGCVRDAVLGAPASDLDVEVYGIDPANLIDLLESRFEIDLVGKEFGIIKLRGVPIDVSIPRRESKCGLGHKGFEIQSDPQMTPSEAAARRDFTINAIVVDPTSGEVIDPFHGVADLRAKILRHTTEKFSEDPLRVLRGMQLAARFELTPALETVEICRTIEPEGLAAERIFGEWSKLIIQGARPSHGLAFLRDCEWIRYFPELETLIGCEQNPMWHPEGDVWVHTLHCMDAFATDRIGDPREDLIVGFAVLCHDLGKPATSVLKNGRITSKGHSEVGAELARSFLRRMTNEESLIDAVIPLITDHLAPVELFGAQAGNAAIRRLARRVGRIDRLVRVASADQRGRPPIVVERFEAGEWLLERACALRVEREAPRPLVMGRHLVELGLEPGERFGVILEACFERQLDGEFDSLEAGIACAREILAERRE